MARLGFFLLALFFGCSAASEGDGGGGGGDENTAETCQDGQDNDGDFAVDCADTDCDAFVFCAGGDSDADTDADTDADADTDTDDICDEQDFEIATTPVRIMFVLDRSSSMEGEKKDQAIAAITDMVTDPRNAEKEFGLQIFPDSYSLEGCSIEGPVVDAAVGTGDAIVRELEGTDTLSGSPVLSVLEWWVSNAGTNMHDDDANRYLLYITDGEPSCQDDLFGGGGSIDGDLADAASDLDSRYGLKTVAIGFGGGVDEGNLNAVAANGGTVFDTFLQADDEAELTAALDAISTETVLCEFSIEDVDAAADPENVNFYFDDEVVPHNEDCAGGDGTVGWSWTDDAHTAIYFCDGSCEDLQTGVDVVSAKFGCPTEELI